MNKISFILSISLCFWLFSCNQSEKTESQKHHMEHSQSSMTMQHLHMLLEHGISMMAQGATLKLQGDKHGDVMLAQSADLLRRAMSGSEMAAMHKGGQGESPAMHDVHDLGAAAFDLLDLMMSLQAAKGSELWHYALNMAAQGSSLKSLAVMGMAGDIDQTMQQHGQTMQEGAMHLVKETTTDTAYQKAVLKVVRLLVDGTPESTQHMH